MEELDTIYIKAKDVDALKETKERMIPHQLRSVLKDAINNGVKVVVGAEDGSSAKMTIKNGIFTTV
ncbi:MAG: hypothetical protein KUG82_21595 [Pseudomonadales bacterium]|nr:hypothetical protein [Pseudomonadales bacterium]